ncbi:MAG TPA: phosphomannomutase/phosphoglucomutase [Intrasporangiaceae bacterium]|nr:phosphomannomutase/phosphoglucomutase [Intrasporangiaceae bacterium]
MSTPALADFIKAYDVRGLVPDQLNPSVTRAIGAAFAEVIARRDGASAVVIGHDMRPSSPELSHAFADGVRDRGLDVRFIGLASTDQLYYASGALDLPGAMFTASHNPARYNGIKLCTTGARPVGQDSGLAQVRDLAQAILDGYATLAPGPTRGSIREEDVLPGYAGFLRSLVDLRGIRPLKVIIDAGNGMAGHTVPAVLGDGAGLDPLPLQIEPMYFDLDGTFPNHEANPLDPANLVDLQERIRRVGADIGLAFDGDADRCFVIDERGAPVSPSAITALVARREIARAVAGGAEPQQVRIVHNVITSQVVPEEIRAAGAEPVRTRVGHSFIKGEMARSAAVFGGEHSAHYYFRDFWFADTGMLAAMHVLAALGASTEPLSAIAGHCDRYPASGEINSTVSDPTAAMAAVQDWAEDAYGPVDLDRLDGLTITRTGPDGQWVWWLNLRASNTEPLLRLNVEARDVATMAELRDAVLSIVRGQPTDRA